MGLTVISVREKAPARAAAARWAVVAVFAVAGATIATLSVRTPSLKAAHGLSTGELGGLAACFGVAALAAMQTVGGLAARRGSASLVRAAALAMPLALVPVAVVPGLPALTAAMLLLGSANGALDVAMNAHGVAVERALGRPILNGCHAAWSIGAVAGSLAGGAAAQLGWSLAANFAAVAAVLVVASVLAGRRLLPAAADQALPAQPDRVLPARTGRLRAAWADRRAGWSRRLVLLGAMGATVLTCEAAVAGWSGVLLHEHLGAGLGAASLGYIAFLVCETGGRLVGDSVHRRYPAVRLIRVGALVGAAGLTLVVASRWPAGAVLGFAVLGVGLATPLPVLYGVVGRLGTRYGAAGAVARFTTMTYSGILVAPAVIGWFAQLAGLTWTLAALVPLLCGVALLGGAARAPRAPA
jgi:MFS family permease